MADAVSVLVVQPTIPHYRVSLFDTLAARADLRLTVQASESMVGGPRSADALPAWADTRHSCRELLSGSLYWQRALKIPPTFGRGDVMVVSGNPRFLSNLPLLLEARRRGIGVVWWGHGWSATSKNWTSAIRRWLMSSADVVLLYTDDEVRELGSQGFSRIPLMATNNALDQRRIREAAAAWPEGALRQFREMQGIASASVLLFCGRLRDNPSTELEVAIRALALALKQVPAVRLAVIGKGEEEARLRRLADEQGVAENMLWLGEIYSERELAPWFLSSTCFIYPGAIGLSLLHAFGYGLPVITHSARKLHNPEISALRDGSNGLLFAKGDAAQLAEQIRIVCGNPELRQRMSLAASQTVLTEFSMEQMVERFANAIHVASTVSLDRASRR